MQHGRRLTRLQERQVERLLRDNADLPARAQQELLKEQLGIEVKEITVYRYRNRFGIPKPSEARKLMPIDLRPADRRVLSRLLDYMVLPIFNLVFRRVSLATPGLDELDLGEGQAFRFIIGDSYSIAGCWFTDEERTFFEQVLDSADRRRGSNLLERFRDLHALAVEYANRAYWFRVHGDRKLEKVTPIIRRIPAEMIREVEDEESELAWINTTGRQLLVRIRELVSSVKLAASI